MEVEKNDKLKTVYVDVNLTVYVNEEWWTGIIAKYLT